MKHFSLTLLSVLALSCTLALVPGKLHAQAEPGATRSGTLEVGATISFLKPDATGYLTPNSAPDPTSLSVGGSLYANFDFNQNFGLTGEVNYPTTRTPQDFLEKSFLIGGRFIYPVGRYRAYVKLLAGGGSTSYDRPVPYIAFSGTPATYAIVAYGGGVDYILTRRITLRADLEAQHWGGYPSGAINPFMFSIGGAYRFR